MKITFFYQVQQQNLNNEVNNVVSPHRIEVSSVNVNEEEDEEDSVFNADQILQKEFSKNIKNLWRSIRPLLVNTPLHQIPTIESKFQMVLKEMARVNEYFDSSSLRDKVQEYFVKVKELISLESSSSSKLFEEARDKKLELLKENFEDSTEKANNFLVHNEISSIESSRILTSTELDHLRSLREAVESSRKELEQLELKP